jgi:ParB family chromosome partitioning protein
MAPAAYELTYCTPTRASQGITDLPLDQINIGILRRRELGDIDGLMASIRERGLLQPLVVTPHRWLLSGYRRLEASKRLGYSRIKVTVTADVTQALRILVAERAEHTCCKPFTPSEAVEMLKVLKELVSTQAMPDQARPELQRSEQSPVQGRGRMRDMLAEAVSELSGQTLAKAEVVVDAADANADLIPIREEMDRTGKVAPAYKAVLKAQAKTSTIQDSVQTPQKPTVSVENTIDQLAVVAKRLDKFTRADFYRKGGGRWINERKCERCRVKLVATNSRLQAIVDRLARILEDPLGKATDEFGKVRHWLQSRGGEDR